MKSSEWKEVKLKEVCDFAKKSIKPKFNIQYTQYSLPAFDNNKIPEITMGENILSNKFVVEKDVILFNKLNLRFKRVWNINEVLPNSVCSTEFIPILAKDIDKNFLYYTLISDKTTNELEATKIGTSSSHQRIKPEVLFEYELLLPHLETQKQIAKVLSSIDDKIGLNNKINDNLEKQAQAIFKSWFVDFEPFGGVMPSDWEVAPFGSFVTIKRGGSPRPIQEYLSNSGLRWLKISDVSTLNTPFINEIKEHIKETGLNKTVFLKAGSLVLSNSATPGIPKILDVDSCIHDGWLYFLNSEFSNEYMYLFFKHIKSELLSFGNGSVFTNLKTDILKNFETAKPTNIILNDFDEILKPIFRKMKYCTKESIRLSQLRDTLLPRLMSGEIDVSQVEI